MLPGCDPREGARSDHVTVERPAPAPEDVDGRELYMRKCARCHGEYGEGDGPGAVAYARVADLGSPELQQRLSDERIGSIIRNGMARMPPVHGLHDVEVDAIIAYVRTLER